MDFHRRAIIVCESIHHQNTRTIAHAIGEVLSAQVMMPAEIAVPSDLARYDLVGFGSGIYFGRPHRSLRKLIDRIDILPTKVFLFSTSGLPLLAWLWHAGLRRKLSGKKARLLGEFSCRGWDTVGPLFVIGGLNRGHPNNADIVRAEEFARQMMNGDQIHRDVIENSPTPRR